MMSMAVSAPGVLIRSFPLRTTIVFVTRRSFRQAAIAVLISCGTLTAQTAASPWLMPLPAHLALAEGPPLAIDGSFRIVAAGPGAIDPRVKAAVERAEQRVWRQTGLLRNADAKSFTTLTVTVQSLDHPAPQKLGDNEHYTLTVTASGAKLTADAPLGALRGLETFLQLIGQVKTGFAASAVTIDDAPRYPWRGLSLDVSRHFIPLADVKRTLDGMAAMKLNVFHWHLSDDQGFRVESKRFPKLQGLGSDGHYYTQAQVREAIEYARLLGIRVVPEFDMPGHATSWMVGYPELGSAPGPYTITRKFGIFPAAMDPTRESTYVFLDGFLAEMTALFPDEYFHVGGDEVMPDQWKASPKIQAFMKQHSLPREEDLQAYFNQRLQKLVAKHGKHMEGWDEVLQPGIPKDVLIQSWRGQKALAEAARKGYEGLLSAGYYLDLMFPAATHYAVDPLTGETASLTPEQQKRVLGGEAAMWEELAVPENLDAKLWPRLAAIAERFWSPATPAAADSLYSRLNRVSVWLEESVGLRQQAALRAMRRRIANGSPVEPLDTFAEMLEPVKEYNRNTDGDLYTQFTPLNRLVDSIPPESEPAREFNALVDRYLANRSGSAAATDLAAIDNRLSRWAAILPSVRAMIATGPLVADCGPVADRVEKLTAAGRQAVDRLKSGKTGSEPGNTLPTELAMKDAPAELLIQIEPGVRKLVAAAAQR